MDHTRHMSSPSPTSSFLFHHSERNYKPNPLNPLLSSAAEIANVDDCFSANDTAANMHHDSFGGDDHHSLVDNELGHHHSSHHQPELHHQHHHHHHHHLQHHHHNDSQCVIDHDSLTGVDDDDGMHNMLSGSSTSSTSTMPMLTESHSHHSFSRISLGEYSPLSLVEDCDNALAISPTSLTLGSHHSFKSSLNGLSKIDNLVDVTDNVDDVVVGGGDARSMSPTLLSHASTSNNHNNLWSNSSTAITQNPTLLGSSSTSFLLSHHHHHHHHHPHHHHLNPHHHQFSSLMQQLEPTQSLDDPVPLLSNGGGSALDGQHSDFLLASAHLRPSSEPPPGIGIELSADIETKSTHSQSSQTTTTSATTTAATTARPIKQNGLSKSSQSDGSNKTAVKMTCSTASLATHPSRPSRRNRSRSNSRPSTYKDLSSNRTEHAANGKSIGSFPEPESLSSKVHLQLNHQEKLRELQQRLFGPKLSDASGLLANEAFAGNSATSSSKTSFQAARIVKLEISGGAVKQEPDSSANDNNNNNNKSNSDGNNNKLATDIIQEKAFYRTRPVRSRRGRLISSNTSNKTDESQQQNSLGKNKRVVTTETAEPDTTTKSSECIRLADLLSTTSNADTFKTNNNTSFGLILDAGNNTSSSSVEKKNDDHSSNINNITNTNRTIILSDDLGDKRVQQIQLQVSPSLTVVANSVQPINIKQQQQQQGQLHLAPSGAGQSSANSFSNQITCRPPTTSIASNSQQQLQIKTANESILKNAGEAGAILSNWTLQAASNSVNQGNNTGQTTTIGAHQIAIQVICQDGTSLVLPVSSAAGLNAAVQLTSQHHQQLQAALNNNSGNSSHNNNNNNSNINNSANGNQDVQFRSFNQVLPLVSLPHVPANAAQQQQASESSAGETNHAGNGFTSSSQSNQSTSSSSSSSGLAASSPTLAALLDAGSNRNYTNSVGESGGNNSNLSSNNQGFISSNLLRKLVSGAGGSTDFKLADLGSSGIKTGHNASNQVNLNGKSTSDSSGPNSGKKVKLERSEIASNSRGNNNNNKNGASSTQQTTFTLVDTQGLNVTNGNDTKVCKQVVGGIQVNKQTLAVACDAPTSASNRPHAGASGMRVNDVGAGGAPGGVGATISKPTKMTGNRQVDPTQPFRCEHCNSTFTRLGNFTRHKKIHTVPTKDGQRFKCDVCSKSFLQRCDLARHLHIHRGTEPHRCNICGKGYIRHSDLVTHQRFHNKEKPFGCPHCSKGFCQRGDLNRHLRSIHLQMKPILCPCCNRKFAKQETLLRHLNTAHRSKPGTTTPISTTANNATVMAELQPNYTLTTATTATSTPGRDDKQQAQTISVITTCTPTQINISNVIQQQQQQQTKNSVAPAPVASLQAIQATLCKVQQSADQTATIHAAIPTTEEAKVVTS